MQLMDFKLHLQASFARWRKLEIIKNKKETASFIEGTILHKMSGKSNINRTGGYAGLRLP